MLLTWLLLRTGLLASGLPGLLFAQGLVAAVVPLLPAAVPDTLPPGTLPVPAPGPDRVGVRESLLHRVREIAAARPPRLLLLRLLLLKPRGHRAELRSGHVFNVFNVFNVFILVEPRGEKRIRVALLRPPSLVPSLHSLAVRHGTEPSLPRHLRSGPRLDDVRGEAQGCHRVGVVLAGEIQRTRRGLGGVSQGLEIVAVGKLDVLDRLGGHVSPRARRHGDLGVCHRGLSRVRLGGGFIGVLRLGVDVRAHRGGFRLLLRALLLPPFVSLVLAHVVPPPVGLVVAHGRHLVVGGAEGSLGALFAPRRLRRRGGEFGKLRLQEGHHLLVVVLSLEHVLARARVQRLGQEVAVLVRVGR